MKNLIIHETTYTRVYQEDENNLIKYSPVKEEAWKSLIAKDLSFVNTPKKVEPLSQEEKNIYINQNSKITLPFLQDYETLYHTKDLDNLSTEQLIKLIIKITELIKVLHKNNVYHTDIHSRNIMINQSKDIQLIDFDAMIIDDYISKENMYSYKNIYPGQKKSYSKVEDKLGILSLLFYYLSHGTFKGEMKDYIELEPLNLPNFIKQELSSYQLKLRLPYDNYYFEDILTELLQRGYESPKLYNRK